MMANVIACIYMLAKNAYKKTQFRIEKYARPGMMAGSVKRSSISVTLQRTQYVRSPTNMMAGLSKTQYDGINIYIYIYIYIYIQFHIMHSEVRSH
jgi:hypothetical protein